MAPLRSIWLSVRPITITDGDSAGANRPLREKPSQIKHANPTERIAPSVVLIRSRLFVTSKIFLSPRRQLIFSFKFLVLSFEKTKNSQLKTQNYFAPLRLCGEKRLFFHHPPANHRRLFDFLEDQLF